MATGTTNSSRTNEIVIQKYVNGEATGPEIHPSISGGTWTANLEASTDYKLTELESGKEFGGPGPWYFTTDGSGDAGELSTTPSGSSTIVHADLSSASEGDVLTIDAEGNVIAAPPAP